MANMKNAKKKIKVFTDHVRKINMMKTACKNVEKAVAAKDKDKAADNLKVAIKRIDKAKTVGAIKGNTAARNKSRLTKKVNAME